MEENKPEEILSDTEGGPGGELPVLVIPDGIPVNHKLPDYTLILTKIEDLVKRSDISSDEKITLIQGLFDNLKK